MSFESLLSYELDSSTHDTQKPSTLLFNPSGVDSAPDDITNELIRDPLIAPLDTLYEQIRYCNFLLGAEVSESTLQALSKEILTERGPLPVGEIGKMLQEITGISTLSAYLKDKFGGLKKFLENFEDEFVICTDHPFNPHVFLKNTLTHDEYNLIISGIIPPHLTAKANKRRATRKKRLSNSSMQSSYSDVSSPPPSTSITANIRNVRTPGSNFRPEGLRAVMSSPYLASLAQQSYRNSNHYQGESWDLSAGSSTLGRLSHTMSSSALERLVDPYDHGNYRTNILNHNNNNINNNGMILTGNNTISTPPSSSSYRSLPQPHSPYQDNYGQYTDLGYSSGHSSSSYRLGGVGQDEEFQQSDLDPYANPRRRKTLPSVPNHNSSPSFDGYGHIGIPDPRAPAFIPGTGYR